MRFAAIFTRGSAMMEILLNYIFRWVALMRVDAGINPRFLLDCLPVSPN
jgi:hypothetical protein